MQYNLCKEYPALSPFDIDNTAFFDVLDLFARTRKMQIRIQEKIDETREDKVQIIRRPAGDDWF
jgi:hypothetical protein